MARDGEATAEQEQAFQNQKSALDMPLSDVIAQNAEPRGRRGSAAAGGARGRVRGRGRGRDQSGAFDARRASGFTRNRGRMPNAHAHRGPTSTPRAPGVGRHGRDMQHRGRVGRQGNAPSARTGVPSQPASATAHRLHEEVFKDDNGDVVLTLHGIEIVRAKHSGEMVLHCGSLRGYTLRRAIGEALQLFGLELREPQVPSLQGELNVTDGYSFLRRFTDGMNVPPLGQPGPGRAEVLLETMTKRIATEKQKYSSGASSHFAPY